MLCTVHGSLVFIQGYESSDQHGEIGQQVTMKWCYMYFNKLIKSEVGFVSMIISTRE